MTVTKMVTATDLSPVDWGKVFVSLNPTTHMLNRIGVKFLLV